MAAPLYLVAGKATDSVTHGFLPAAARLGLDVTLLTDRPAPPMVRRARRRCDVTDFREIIAAVAAGAASPRRVFSNSDFLQAPTALAAAYFGLPGKDWRAATRTKNKALMRRHLAFLDPVFSADARRARRTRPYPLVLKPREGVASEDVFLVRGRRRTRRPLEEIGPGGTTRWSPRSTSPGRLHTLETLGTGTSSGARLVPHDAVAAALLRRRAP